MSADDQVCGKAASRQTYQEFAGQKMEPLSTPDVDAALPLAEETLAAGAVPQTLHLNAASAGGMRANNRSRRTVAQATILTLYKIQKYCVY